MHYFFCLLLTLSSSKVLARWKNSSHFFYPSNWVFLSLSFVSPSLTISFFYSLFASYSNALSSISRTLHLMVLWFSNLQNTAHCLYLPNSVLLYLSFCLSHSLFYSSFHFFCSLFKPPLVITLWISNLHLSTSIFLTISFYLPFLAFCLSLSLCFSLFIHTPFPLVTCLLSLSVIKLFPSTSNIIPNT